MLARMPHVQAHRGPDDSGLWDRKFPADSYNLLGSRRPAILDLSPSGMASSVELAEFVAWYVPPNLKLKGLFPPPTKYFFRQAMRDILSSEVLRQPKAGFAAPVDYWLAHDLKEMLDDLLSPAQLRRRGLLQPAAVQNYIDEHRSGRHDWSMQLWQFLTLELWMQTFLDGGARKFESEMSPSGQVATA